MKEIMIASSMLFSTWLALAAAQTPPPPPTWQTVGPRVDEESFAFELPLEVLATKLLVEIEFGGATRRFVFDTGSPSMLSSDLASKLGLTVIDRRQGRDSHGAIIDTGIVQSDVVLGGTTFRNVPMFVADFPPTARCLFDGVLGSELLPMCAWQIDLPNSVLRCSTRLEQLEHVQAAVKLPLHDFGYPHSPFLDIRFARDATSKALFDTGSSEYLAISPPDLEGARRSGAVAATVSGAGSLGGSLGGAAPRQDQLLIQLKSLAVGTIELGRVMGPRRELAPSLVGASVLEHFVVTLDQRSGAAYFDRYRGGPFARPFYGLGMSFDKRPEVSLLWEGSPAEVAGLRVGQPIDTLNGQPTGTSCDAIRNALRVLSKGAPVELGSDGRVITLTPRQQIRGQSRTHSR